MQCGLLVGPADDPPGCAPSDRDLAAENELKQAIDNAKAQGLGDADIAALQARLKALTARRCEDMPPTRIVVDCGIALDCNGNELVARRPIPVDLWRELSAEDRKTAETGDDGQTLYVSLCYCEQGVDPIRPVLADQCGTVSECAFGKVRESVRIFVGLTAPEDDARCDSCCAACGECCLLLARIDGFRRGYPLEPGQIHNEVRRRLGAYQSTVITGINWVHDGDYLSEDAEKILGTNDDTAALEIHFSRPILTSSLRRGVVELWRIEGGLGRSSGISEIEGEFVLDGAAETTVVRYRQTDEERMNYGDRILIQVRCAFLLDRCCRPVDGAHIGGRVPALPDTIAPQNAPVQPDCAIPPWGYAPWTSGSGVPGSNFESWLTIAEPPAKPKLGVK